MALSVEKLPTSSPSPPGGEPGSVPLRQFSLYRPPYEELYTFWWKCMQITLHDKGTQTLHGPDNSEIAVPSSPADSEPTQPQDSIVNSNGGDNKTQESDQLKQLMAMVNYYNSTGRDSRSKVPKTFRGASSLAPAGFSPSMLASSTKSESSSPGERTTPPLLTPAPAVPISTQTEPSMVTNSAAAVTSAAMMTSLSSPRMTSPRVSSPSSASSSPATSTGGCNRLTPAGGSPTGPISAKMDPPTKIKMEPGMPPKVTEISASSLSAVFLAQPFLTQAMSHLSSSSPLVSSSSSPTVTLPPLSTTSAVVVNAAAGKPITTSTPIKQEVKTSISDNIQSLLNHNSEQLSDILQLDTSSDSDSGKQSLTSNIQSLLSDNCDQLSDLIHIKQLTDVLGRKAVLDSLTPSISTAGNDISHYLAGSNISMPQVASLLGQLPNSSPTRSLLASLSIPSFYNVEQALKTDGFSSSLDQSGGGKPVTTTTTTGSTRTARHYQAAEQDTSNITLPEGFESEDHLTWAEVEDFVNDFKTKRVKLGYTQAHVGAALALVHGPEFSQTTISRFEGLQLSFPNHKKIIPILRRWLESVENPTKRRHHSPSTGVHGGQNGNGKRRKRTTISSNSKEVLEQYYQTNSLPSTDEIGNLSNNLGLDKRVIRIWFQNRRAIGKRLSKLIVTMGGGSARQTTTPLATMQPQQGLF